MKLLRIICHTGIYEYTRMPFGIKNAPSHFQRMMDTIFQEEILEGWMVVYIDDIIIYSETWEDHEHYIDRVLSKCTPTNLKISLKNFNFGQQELLFLGHKVSGLSLAIDQSKVAALLLKPLPKNIKKMQFFFGFASYYRSHIRKFAHITSISEVYTECTALKSLINMKTTNRQMLRWQIAIQEYSGNMTIIYKECKSHTNADGLSLWPLDNARSNPAYDPEVAAKIPIHLMEIDRRKYFRFSEWAPESSTPKS
ncbi:hypothetical protein O181_032853 [Austropuccinia psidii MF-1]|uniref:Reverse transcriptase domain-containing protein n=1 Tax=Austropuccinia psidii MF-1 TaxID=1389203 RepID=A0A9Q3D2F3_9BASI|nr:hypothetical protein [Austropuccinia psidii MF-1]